MTQKLRLRLGPDRCRPLLKWAGGKSGLLSQISDHLPQSCSTYFEPFLGGGAVYFALENPEKAVINDANAELFVFYEVVRDHPRELMDALDALAKEYSEEFYYELRSSEPRDPVAKAARTVFLNKTGFNGLYRQNSTGAFNVPFGKRVKCPSLYDRENTLLAASKLAHAKICNLDFADIISQAGPGDLVYCDPPYEPLSTTSSFNAYRGGGFSQSEQLRLLKSCLEAQARGAWVLVSNSSAPFILNLYKDFELAKVTANRAVNSKGSRRGAVDEVVLVLRSPKAPRCETFAETPPHQEFEYEL